MRILRNGLTTAETWRTEATCTGCNSLLEVGTNDLAYVADARDGDAVTFSCAVCGKKHWMAAGLLPREVRSVVTK